MTIARRVRIYAEMVMVTTVWSFIIDVWRSLDTDSSVTAAHIAFMIALIIVTMVRLSELDNRVDK